MEPKVNLGEKLGSFDETWVPKIVSELNGQYVKVVKFLGEYVWHRHEGEDEMFLVMKGHLQIHLRDGIVDIPILIMIKSSSLLIYMEQQILQKI